MPTLPGGRNIASRGGLPLALAVIVIPLLAAIIIQVYEAVERPRQLAHDRRLIANTFQVISTAEAIKSAAQNAERSQRGFLLTGTPRFLEAYHDELKICTTQLALLRQLTIDNPEQQRRVPTLEVALEEWIAERQHTVDVYTRDGFAAAQKLVSSRAGLDTFRAADSVIEATIGAERDLLLRRQARATEHEEHAGRMFLLGAGIDLGLLALGMWLTVRAFRRARDREIERRTTELRLNQQLTQTQLALAQTQKMEALGQLTGGVAHDFNNLLHVIRNALAIVQRRLSGSDQEVTRYLEMAQKNIDRAADTTGRLLAFSRQQPLDPKPTNINKVVYGMAELLRSVLGEGVLMETVLSGGLWPVAVDKNQLETAVINLAVNGRDAIHGRGKLTIETSNSFLDDAYVELHSEVKPGQYSMIAVSDTGFGMTKETAARAFDPFFTTKESGRGTGLGLSQVFGFVKQSGGHIKIYSELGQGTTVKMYFPRLMDPGAEQPEERVDERSAGTGESILLVEDNEDVCAFTAQMLRDMGYRVAVAMDASSALKAMEEGPGVDLLFTDVGLPGGMGGRELADEARRRWPPLKVLYTTGYARNSIIHHGRLDAGVDLIPKPFTESNLAAVVRRVLDKVATTKG